MEEHKQYCPMKPAQCKYCELVVPRADDEYNTHITYCGSKTKECEICGMKVVAKELEGHIVSGQCDTEVELKQERAK
jgi:hypothetical protein